MSRSAAGRVLLSPPLGKAEHSVPEPRSTTLTSPGLSLLPAWIVSWHPMSATSPCSPRPACLPAPDSSTDPRPGPRGEAGTGSGGWQLLKQPRELPLCALGGVLCVMCPPRVRCGGDRDEEEVRRMCCRCCTVYTAATAKAPEMCPAAQMASAAGTSPLC